MPTIRTIGIKKEHRKEETPRQFKVVGGLRWEMTDHYGYPVELSQIRNERIDGLLSGSLDDTYQEDIRYSVSLRKTDEDGCHYNIDWYRGKLSLYSTVDDEGQSHLRIKLKCNDFVAAENLIKLLIEGNSLELMPVSRSDFKR